MLAPLLLLSQLLSASPSPAAAASGSPPAAVASSGDGCAVHEGVVIDGHDLLPDTSPLIVSDPAACCTACTANSSCLFWTWYPDQGHCWLLTDCDNLETCPACISGPGQGVDVDNCV